MVQLRLNVLSKRIKLKLMLKSRNLINWNKKRMLLISKKLKRRRRLD